MPSPGKSLVGFMPLPFAIFYMRRQCKFVDDSDAALTAHWHAALAQRGAAVPGAGLPTMRPLAGMSAAWTRRMHRHPRFADAIGTLPWSYQWVEIASLLAYQFHVNLDRIAQLKADCGGRLTERRMIRLCLPDRERNIAFNPAGIGTNQLGHMVLQSPSLDLRIHNAGIVGRAEKEHLMYAGLKAGASVPFVQVVRFKGRCYLHNGYHRASMLAMEGQTHLPCILIDATDYARVNQQAPDVTLDKSLLDGPDPPTIGHLSSGRSYDVPLRQATRLITFAWSETVVVEI